MTRILPIQRTMPSQKSLIVLSVSTDKSYVNEFCFPTAICEVLKWSLVSAREMLVKIS